MRSSVWKRKTQLSCSFTFFMWKLSILLQALVSLNYALLFLYSFHRDLSLDSVCKMDCLKLSSCLSFIIDEASGLYKSDVVQVTVEIPITKSPTKNECVLMKWYCNFLTTVRSQKANTRSVRCVRDRFFFLGLFLWSTGMMTVVSEPQHIFFLFSFTPSFSFPS